MTEFEQIIDILKSMDSRMSNMENRMTGMENRMLKIEKDVAVIKEDISEMKEEMEITRIAANYNGERLDNLIDELRKYSVIS